MAEGSTALEEAGRAEVEEGPAAEVDVSAAAADLEAARAAAASRCDRFIRCRFQKFLRKYLASVSPAVSAYVGSCLSPHTKHLTRQRSPSRKSRKRCTSAPPLSRNSFSQRCRYLSAASLCFSVRPASSPARSSSFFSTLKLGGARAGAEAILSGSVC